jgi:hypothetical protein
MFFGFGCASPQIAWLQPSSDEAGKTLFLMNYNLIAPQNLEWKEDCVIHLKNRKTQTVYQAALKPNQNPLQVELVPGDYDIQDLSCGPSKKWDLNTFGAPEASAFEGKVNYLGHYTFLLSVQDQINHLTVERGDREKSLKALRQTSTDKSDHWKNRLVSAYNGKSIPTSYLADEKAYKRGTTSLVVGEKAALSQMNFDACERKEFKTNPVPFGVLSYQVIYDNNHWVSSKPLKSAHSFSDAYVQCVEEVFRNFSPGYSGHVEYKVNL